MLPDLGVYPLEHPLEDVGELRRKGVDNAVGSGPIKVVSVGEDGATGGLEPGGESLALDKEARTVVEEETDECLFGAGKRGGEGLVDKRPFDGPREEGRDDLVDLACQSANIQRLEPCLHQRPGDCFSGGGRLYYRRAVPGGGLDEVDLPEGKERPRRIGVTTLFDHALPFSPG